MNFQFDLVPGFQDFKPQGIALGHRELDPSLGLEFAEVDLQKTGGEYVGYPPIEHGTRP